MLRRVKTLYVHIEIMEDITALKKIQVPTSLKFQTICASCALSNQINIFLKECGGVKNRSNVRGSMVSPRISHHFGSKVFAFLALVEVIRRHTGSLCDLYVVVAAFSMLCHGTRFKWITNECSGCCV